MINPRDELGLKTGLTKPDAIIWPGERPPSDDNRALLRRAWDDLLANRPDEALGRLSSVVEAAFEGSPSFAMRWNYYTGLALMILAANGAAPEAAEKLDDAMSAFARAHDIALAHASRKPPNQPLPIVSAALVVICKQAADCLSAQMRYDAALDSYLTALAALREHERDSRRTHPAADRQISALVARSQVIVGQFGNAYDNLARAKALRPRRRAAGASKWEWAADEWLQAYILRVQSQRCGGVEDMLREVVRLYKRVEKWLDGDDEHQDSLNRLYIQIAESYLDLAELYREQGQETKYKTCAHWARVYAQQAADALNSFVDKDGALRDEQGALMAELTLARLDHLTFKPYQLVGLVRAAKDGLLEPGSPEALSPRLYDVEMRATELKDDVLLAKAATLRADVLYSLKDYTFALAMYHQAVGRFEYAQARGESARAIFGYRRTLEIL